MSLDETICDFKYLCSLPHLELSVSWPCLNLSRFLINIYKYVGESQRHQWRGNNTSSTAMQSGV